MNSTEQPYPLKINRLKYWHKNCNFSYRKKGRIHATSSGLFTSKDKKRDLFKNIIK